MKCILLIATTLAVLTESILIVADQRAWKKCFYTQHSPDKTLQARLGFLRREKEQCKAHFTVRIVHEGQTRQEIYSKEHYCEQTKPNDSYVLKHTSDQSVSQGMYQICVEMIYNNNQNAIIQIFMGQRLNPIIYEHSDAALPLIEARQLIELDLTVQSIKRSLVNSNTHNKAIRENGQWLDFKIVELMDFNQLSNIMQTITLVVFGFVWIRIVRRLKKDK